MQRTYLTVGSIRLANIIVIYNNKTIYDGSTEELPEQYKMLKYYDIKINSNVITLYVTN